MEFFLAMAAGVVVGILTGRSKSQFLPLIICVGWVTSILVVLTDWLSPSYMGTDVSSIAYAVVCGFTVCFVCYLVTYLDQSN